MSTVGKKADNRIGYIEVLRVLAMLGVIAFHVSKTALSDFNSYVTVYSGTGFLMIRNLVHFAVPVFFMISGALLLDDKKHITLDKLIKKYLVKYLLVLLIFSWGYAYIEQVFITGDIGISSLVNGFMNMLSGNSWAHMWYMYALIWTMLLLPVLRLIAQYFDDGYFRYLAVVVVIFVSMANLINSYWVSGLGIFYPTYSIYGFYMLIGSWINKGRIRFSNKLCIAVIGGSVIILTALAYVQISKIYNVEPFIENHSPLIIIYSAAIFTLAGNMSKKKSLEPGIGVKILSKYSFPIYLTHMFWVNMLYKVKIINPFLPVPVVGFIIAFCSVFCLSLLTGWILKKTPVLKSLL